MRLAAARRRETPAVTTRSPSRPPAHGRAAKGCIGQVERPNLRKIHSFPLFPLADITQKAIPNNQTGVLITLAKGTALTSILVIRARFSRAALRNKAVRTNLFRHLPG